MEVHDLCSGPCELLGARPYITYAKKEHIFNSPPRCSHRTYAKYLKSNPPPLNAYVLYGCTHTRVPIFREWSRNILPLGTPHPHSPCIWMFASPPSPMISERRLFHLELWRRACAAMSRSSTPIIVPQRYIGY